MSKYRVHLYVQVRVPVDVEVPDGTSDEEIVTVAERKAFPQLRYLNLPGIPGAEYAEDTSGYMIDPLLPEGDVDYDNSRWRKWKGQTLVKWED